MERRPFTKGGFLPRVGAVLLALLLAFHEPNAFLDIRRREEEKDDDDDDDDDDTWSRPIHLPPARTKLVCDAIVVLIDIDCFTTLLLCCYVAMLPYYF